MLTHHLRNITAPSPTNTLKIWWFQINEYFACSLHEFAWLISLFAYFLFRHFLKKMYGGGLETLTFMCRCLHIRYLAHKKRFNWQNAMNVYVTALHTIGQVSALVSINTVPRRWVKNLRPCSNWWTKVFLMFYRFNFKRLVTTKIQIRSTDTTNPVVDFLYLRVMEMYQP